MLFDAHTRALTALGGIPCFLMDTVIVQFPYQVDCAYSESDAEFKGTGNDAFLTACRQYGIGREFTRVNSPQTNGETECVIRTLRDMQGSQISFKDKVLVSLFSYFVSLTSAMPQSPMMGLNNATPYGVLAAYTSRDLCKITGSSCFNEILGLFVSF